MTLMQIQHLLAFLGLYSGAVDGISGPQTQGAVRSFQEAWEGLEADGNPGEVTQAALRKAVGEGWEPPWGESGEIWKEIRWFTREEFRCKCAGKYCSGFPAEPDPRLLRAAQTLRSHFGVPVTVTSGLRCQRHNAAAGGVSNSRHLTGKAMDFCVRGVGAEQVLAYLKTLPEIRYAYRIGRNYVHMDVL